MPKPKPQLPLFGLMAVIALFLLPEACIGRNTNKDCGSTMCGNVNISYPFRLTTQPSNCGDHRFELECDNNNHTNLVMKYGRFYVQNISYDICKIEFGPYYLESQNISCETMQAMDANLSKDDNCSLPRNSFLVDDSCKVPYTLGIPSSVMFLVNCSEPMNSSSYINASRCPTRSSYFYFFDSKTTLGNFSESCTIDALVPIMVHNISGMSTSDIYEKLLLGFDLELDGFDLDFCRVETEKPFQYILSSLKFAFRNYMDSFVHFLFHGHNSLPRSRSTYILCLAVTGGVIFLRSFPGIICLLALVTYKWRRRHLSMDDMIEEFLQSQNNLVPIRYSFKKIKKMTKNFKDKLGEGGYGSVFKGKLRSGHHVAIKLLGKSKGNGQDFINEVASIGRIHHANVAKLIGFCVEGSKQALVYDFMSNGSLDKIIFTEENKNTLGWKKMFDIVLGVAQGIHYLHQGCDMQILHFDIKPHNILLDENFNPKVSDFGLAKLYSVDDSIVSLTAARGTIGYIAPELVYKNLGGISYKADVYSFGMLLMEMVGRRKNVNAFADHTSQIYFPSWIYDRLDQGEDIELGYVSDDEKVMVKKMIITAFWCIQLLPSDRPSMSKVLKMLESDVELLEMPPKPFHQLPLETSMEVHNYENSNDETSTPLDNVTIASSNIA
ncbi:hypothetical protein E1A91_A01G042000v1 [Gossypium mustelinum]|uniref:Protein kinase domain-containing protein n=1 Tax=Gossypium mustelinum TaxID=34275 RepID=A0A5D3ABH2_GOSMU|nr:hypothetical protein E1A91_A01G042000v1 [Gossypium mustelinum]